MNALRGLWARRNVRWNPHPEWPFMAFLTFVFVFIYIWTVATSTRLREPLILILFTVLFTVHLALHWLSIWWLKKKWSPWLYLGIQAALVFVLVSIAGVIGALLGLYMGMIGEAVGLLSSSWPKKAAAVAGLLLLSALNFLWVLPGQDLIWWVLAVLPTTIFVVIYVVLYGRQADARVKAQELLAELETANRRLTEYADRIEDLTLTAERQRMARELHDTLAQGLAGLILELEATDSHLGQGRTDRAQAIVRQAMARARDVLAESRRAIDGLRNETPGDLEQAVRAEVDHFTSASGVPCTLDLNLSAPLPESAREFALRMVSEGLTNIARHAQARRASVALRGGEGALEIEIADDGIGFDAAGGDTPTGHYGLIGLRERARQASGALDVRHGVGGGTILSATIPVPPNPDPR